VPKNNILKKVLFILHYPPPIHGAAKVGEYIKNSKAINEEFHCKHINLSTSKTIDEIGKGKLLKWFRYFKILYRTFKEIRKFKPDLVYLTLTTTSIGFYKDSMVALLVKAFKIPMTYHFHNKGVKNRHERWFDHQLYKRVLKNVDIILLSKYLYSDIKKYVPEDRVYYCPNGIPQSSNTFDYQSIRKDKSVPNILFLSNLIKSKGVDVLLEACKFLKEKKIVFKCTFVGGEGDISATQFQESIKSLQIENIVSYVGKKYGQDKEKAYLNADIFVLPTMYKNECFPLVLLEAMHYSLPVVSTKEGGIPDIIDHGVNGLLIDNQTPEKLGAQIEILLKDPELCVRMGEKGRSLYLKHFTQEVFEELFIKTISQIAG